MTLPPVRRPNDLDDNGTPYWMPVVVTAIGLMYACNKPVPASLWSTTLTIGPYSTDALIVALHVRLNESGKFTMELTGDVLKDLRDETIEALNKMVVERLIMTGEVVNIYCRRSVRHVDTIQIEVTMLRACGTHTDTMHWLHPVRVAERSHS